MARIYPFQAWRYNQQKIGALTAVVTQPYDKITTEMQTRYYAAHPFNLVRIIRGQELPDDSEQNNVYARAAQAWREWKEQGVFVRNEAPAVYAYFQRYEVPGGRPVKVRKGFIALGQLEDYRAGVVFPHERTLAGPKLDRLRLLRATRTHFEQLFMLYSDPEHGIDKRLDEVSAREPEMRATDEYGVEHLVWSVSDPTSIRHIQQVMADQKLIIADGHHRYETALAYRNERRAEAGRIDDAAPYEKVVMTFINTESEGLTILPTHRVMRNLESFHLDQFLAFAKQHFDIEQYDFTTASALRHAMEQRGGEQPTFGMYATGQRAFYVLSFRASPESLVLMSTLSARQQKLDVAILHGLLIEQGLGLSVETIAQREPIAYVRELEAAVRMIDEGQGQVCFFLNPTRIEQVREIALAGEVLPQKSTDFYPKLLSGLVTYAME
jgi:uncharacterized protein (DUF1015 family)